MATDRSPFTEPSWTERGPSHRATFRSWATRHRSPVSFTTSRTLGRPTLSPFLAVRLMTALGRSPTWPNLRRMAEARTPRRRSGLHQERSRQTRQRLVRAALELWTERGFESGVEDTTVEEIVGAAGVTKGTFYFHFARKEEILLEMGWDTAAVVNEEARRCLKAGRSLDDSF